MGSSINQQSIKQLFERNNSTFLQCRIRKIEGLKVMGEPQVCIVAFSSEEFSIYSMADRMKEKGWLLACLQYPTW
jgi:glutamate/tyrosine decarboxylase-like PLP-dependent enzyme